METTVVYWGRLADGQVLLGNACPKALVVQVPIIHPEEQRANSCLSCVTDGEVPKVVPILWGELRS